VVEKSFENLFRLDRGGVALAIVARVRPCYAKRRGQISATTIGLISYADRVIDIP
jgi:hypothetical protein